MGDWKLKYKQLDNMDDYIKQLDTILFSVGEKLLVDAGAISHNKAIEKSKRWIYEISSQNNKSGGKRVFRNFKSNK